MKVHLRSPKGLTLVEILLAVAIMAYVILGVAGLFNYITKSTMAGEFSTLAVSYAREKMEDIKNRTFDNIPDGTWSADQSRLGQAESMLFTRQVSVNYMDVVSGVLIVSGAATDLKRVTITVTWSERQADRSVVLTSLVARRL